MSAPDAARGSAARGSAAGGNAVTSGPIVVAGYASLDYAMTLAPFRGTDATTLVRDRAEVWPRVGGIAHVTAAIARATDAPVSAVSWVGPDSDGTLWRDEVEAAEVDVSAVSVAGTRSPSSHLLYPEDGGTICLFDPADCHPDAVTEAQTHTVRAAEWVVLAVGPEAPSRHILHAVQQDATLVWVVKHDAASVPAELRREILQRADIVTMSENEIGFIEDQLDCLRPGALVVETRGSRGARILTVVDGGLREAGETTVTPVHGVDTTGAGDTFTGTFVAELAGVRWRGDELSAESAYVALQRAAAATAAMLLNRKNLSARTEPS